MYRERLWACILGGVVAGAVCLVGRQIALGSPEDAWASIAATVANRVLLGFVIGISGWRINHLVHGAVLGLLFSLSVSIGFLGSDLLPFFLYTVAGIVYGALIEWFSTDVLKAPMKTA